MTEQQARALISQLTLEEKLALNTMLEKLERGGQHDTGDKRREPPGSAFDLPVYLG